MIKKLLLELWCMAYGLGMFMLITGATALFLGGMCILFVLFPRKKRDRAS